MSNARIAGYRGNSDDWIKLCGKASEWRD